MLTISNHDRDRLGLTYVYPVLSRRAGGLSIGVNLNPNNACNWRCMYCQVPDLQRGAAPPVDVDLLVRELSGFLDDVLHGDFFQRDHVPPEARTIRDLAISGNGEPTSAAEFPDVVTRIGELLRARGLLGRFALVLISNGSLVHLPRVREGLQRWAELGGELWFKLDSATDAGLKRINGAEISAERVWRNLQSAAVLCPTWLQTCVFRFDGQPPDAVEQAAYLKRLKKARDLELPLRGVLLYGLARPSRQPEAPRLSRVEDDWLQAFARRIRATGFAVKVSP
ncbi:MAG TPA: radical SAM protein [Methylococcaceae bacterium]|nr:radical SAM protein [Methylococcaceae bacterium]